MEIMEATPKLNYQIEKNSELQESGTILIYTEFVTQMDIDLMLDRSSFLCSLSNKELIEDDEEFLRKQELYHFLTESRVDELDAITLMKILIRLAIEETSSVEYFPHYALSIWLTFDVVVPLRQESNLDESQIELDEYERSVRFRPAKEFKTGRKIVTLECSHEFDDKCIVEWFKVNHVCPLCRFALPCEDDGLCLCTDNVS
ncbi:hypothetical protein HID58_087661 [Brassica napus]|uniref:RING-type domain-containing protein n=1 Tax=Brassica napus TaxID=3708 RepID=A0ABQ7XTX1_BRANA|nr:hypothetical protein HID58_087661 [Brassica napus]